MTTMSEATGMSHRPQQHQFAPQSAPPPTKAEVQRRLSTRTRQQQQQQQQQQKQNSTPLASPAGYESDSSVASSTLPPLLTVSLGGQYTASPAASPVVATQPPHSALSAIAERHGSSIDLGTEQPMEIGLGGAEEVEDSEDDHGAKDDIGVEGQRVFKSGFLIKRQERRKAVWRKKWFVLRSTKLAYYKDNREYSLSRNIELKSVHSVVAVVQEKQKHPFAFAIVTAERTFFVEALSAEERDDWVRAILSVQKRMSDKEGGDEARRRDKAETKAVPVPAPLRQDSDVETHHGTWTSTFSSTSASTSPSASGHTFHRSAPTNVPPSSYAAPSSFQPPPPINAQPRSSSPSTANSLSQQLAGVSIGRSPSQTAMAPSAASVNRRLSNPIAFPPSHLRALERQAARRDASGGSTEVTLSPPVPTSQFVSSDEEEAYLSDPNAAWPDSPSHPSGSAIDPNKAIVATYLMKKSRKTARRVWRKRWFFVTSAGITYTKSHMDHRPLSFIPLSTVLDVFSVDPGEVDDDDESSDNEYGGPTRNPSFRKDKPTKVPHEHVLRIVTNKRRFDLCAPSEEEEIKWIAAIRALVNRERERRQTASGPRSPRAEAQVLGQQPANIPTISQLPPTPSIGAGIGASIPSTSPPKAAEQSAPFTPTHGRSRSATQTAKNAVADVVRRFHEGQ